MQSAIDFAERSEPFRALQYRISLIPRRLAQARRNLLRSMPRTISSRRNRERVWLEALIVSLSLTDRRIAVLIAVEFLPRRRFCLKSQLLSETALGKDT